MSVIAVWNKIYKTLASVRTGIILLLSTVILAAVGTVILQRPTTEPDEILHAYTPQTLAWLDRLGLTDVYHTWYFLALLGTVSLSIIFVSIERWPNAWRFYARPYRFPEPHFRATLPLRATIPVADGAAALQTAEKIFKDNGLPVEREVDHEQVSLYSESHRFSVFAVFIVHASLLMIFMGGIVDGIIGYRGYLMLNRGETGNRIELRAGKNGVVNYQNIPFSVRADKIGMDRYADGAPKKYWSDLTIIENGKEIEKKTIIVNDPLTYKGIRLFQAGMGKSESIEVLELQANGPGGSARKIELAPDQVLALDDQYAVKLLKFIPDAYIQDGEVFKRSDNLSNPAFQLALIDKAGTETKMWLIPSKLNQTAEATAYTFSATDLKMLDYTGLEVAYQPGQWLVWGGVVLMALGLGVVFYMVHMRFWMVVINDDITGPVLWIGGACNRNRDRFESRFKDIVEKLRSELPAKAAAAKASSAQPLAHV